jgi:hypothetical protein
MCADIRSSEKGKKRFTRPRQSTGVPFLRVLSWTDVDNDDKRKKRNKYEQAHGSSGGVCPCRGYSPYRRRQPVSTEPSCAGGRRVGAGIKWGLVQDFLLQKAAGFCSGMLDHVVTKRLVYILRVFLSPPCPRSSIVIISALLWRIIKNAGGCLDVLFLLVHIRQLVFDLTLVYYCWPTIGTAQYIPPDHIIGQVSKYWTTHMSMGTWQIIQILLKQKL